MSEVRTRRKAPPRVPPSGIGEYGDALLNQRLRIRPIALAVVAVWEFAWIARAANPDALYETDFYAWTRRQARELRRLEAPRLNVELDLDHVAEEIEDLGTAERDTCRSQVERILEHFLKLAWSPSPPPRRGRKRSIVEARSVLEKKLSASIRRDLTQRLPRLYRAARRAAILALEEYDEAEAARLLPEADPWTLQDVLRDDWYPDSRLP